MKRKAGIMADIVDNRKQTISALLVLMLVLQIFLPSITKHTYADEEDLDVYDLLYDVKAIVKQGDNEIDDEGGTGP